MPCSIGQSIKKLSAGNVELHDNLGKQSLQNSQTDGDPFQTVVVPDHEPDNQRQICLSAPSI
jgi:hypothetical protein